MQNVTEEERPTEHAQDTQGVADASGDAVARPTARRPRRASPKRARVTDECPEQCGSDDHVQGRNEPAAGSDASSHGVGGDAQDDHADSRGRGGGRRGSGPRSGRQSHPLAASDGNGEGAAAPVEGGTREHRDNDQDPNRAGSQGGNGAGSHVPGHNGRPASGQHVNGGHQHGQAGGTHAAHGSHHADGHDEDDDEGPSDDQNGQERGHDRGRHRGRGRGGDDRRNGGRGRPTSGWMATLAQWIDNPQSQPNTIKGHGCEQGVQQLEELGCEAFLVDLSGARTREEVMEAFGRGMKLPPGYNEHWDRFEEALFPPKGQDKPRVIVMRGFHALRRRDSFLADVLFDVLETVANTPNGGFRGVVYCR